MIAFFLTISIILNFVCLFAVVVLFVRQNRLVELEARQKQSLQEMEDLLSSFIYEMKEENQQLFSMLSTTQTNHSHIQKAETSSEQKQERIKKEQQEKETVSQPKKIANPTLAKKAYHPKEDHTVQHEDLPPWLDLGKEQAVQDTNPVNAEMQNQIIKLYREGQSIEAIAKTVNKGKTEIELTLKFFGIL